MLRAVRPSCRVVPVLVPRAVVALGVVVAALGSPPPAFAQSGQIRTPGEIQQPKGTWQVPGEIKQPTGPWRTPGEIQKPGETQKPGQIQTIREQCQRRFRVGSDTLFEFDRASLTREAERSLVELGPMVKQEGAHPVSVEGHTDAIGTAEYNQRLSLDRARAVKEWLVSHRFAPESTAIRGYGKDRPVAPNTRPDGSDDPDGRQQNRRVEVVVDTCR